MESPSTWLASSRFHQSFLLPADPTSNRLRPLRVTYSDIGCGSNDTLVPRTNLASSPLPKVVVVFIGGLMGGRYTLLQQHDFCVHHGIRILTVDRPGMGGSDPVPISQRMTTWLETFPALLSHLDIPHVAIACHSGGTIYTMNTLLHHRRLLHPVRPCVSFLAPWVYPDDSGTMKLLTWLPSAGPAHFHNLVKLVHNYVSPTIGFSSGASEFLVSNMSRKSEGARRLGAAEETSPSERGHDRTREDLGWMKEARTLITNYLVSEDVTGSSDEATLLLRKSKSTLRWGGDKWADYSEATKLIAAEFNEGLDVSVFHATTDKLNGPGGARYFDHCWEEVSSKASSSNIHYTSQKCEGTDHDSIVDPLEGPLREWLLRLIENEQPK